jgi:serine O-acetyltransferase
MSRLSEDLEANRDGGLLAKALIVTLWAGRASRRRNRAQALLLFPVRLLAAVCYRILSVSLGCSVPFSASIGRRVRWVHAFNGVFISREAVIGDDCTILHQVTIGSNFGSRNQKSPVIGDRVFIGAGAKIIGEVMVGDDARIGANALVVEDVPAGATIVAPAAITTRRTARRAS